MNGDTAMPAIPCIMHAGPLTYPLTVTAPASTTPPAPQPTAPPTALPPRASSGPGSAKRWLIITFIGIVVAAGAFLVTHALMASSGGLPAGALVIPSNVGTAVPTPSVVPTAAPLAASTPIRIEIPSLNVSAPVVFFAIKNLHPNDQIKVVRADGTTATFAVDGVQKVEKSTFPTEAIYGSSSTPIWSAKRSGGLPPMSVKDY